MADMMRAAENVVRFHLGIKPDEQVLVITDEWRRDIGAALYSAARLLGAEAVYIELIERQMDGDEPPSSVAAAMQAADVVIAPTTKSLTYTRATRQAINKGVRIASMPGVTEDMVTRALRADPSRLEDLGNAYEQAFTEASLLRLTTGRGTDLTFEIAGQKAASDSGDLRAPGAWGDLPAGEAFVVPHSAATSGPLFVDGSLSPDGFLDSPVRLDLVNGVVRDVTGDAPLFAKNISADPGLLTVGRVGLGVNERAMITGNPLEDRKVLSTGYIRFGDGFIHHDAVLKMVTIELDGQAVVRNGRLLLTV